MIFRQVARRTVSSTGLSFMAHSPKRKAKRPRKVPRTIARKTDREIMEACFPKRVLSEVDRVLTGHRKTPENASE